MNAVIYARFSSAMQNEMSIEAQVRACKEYALRNSLTVIDVFADEAVSGKTTKRTQYQRMLRQAQAKKFDVILIHKYDRISRNLGDHVNLSARLNELDIKLIAVAQDFGDGKEAKMMKSIQWVMAEYYIDNLSEEVRKGHKEVALRGLHNGGYPPFGYDIVNQQYVINPIEAEYVRRMFDAVIRRLGYKEIVSDMQKAGITGKRGKPILHAQINEILHNEKYTGVYIYTQVEEKERSARRLKPNAIRVEGAIPQIIDKATWKEVQRIMSQRKQTGKHSHRCSGLVYCECGAKMHVNRSTRKGYEYTRFVCSAKCGAKSIRAEVIDKCVDTYFATLFSERNKQEIAKRLNEYAKNETQMLKDFEETRASKIKEKQAQIDNLIGNMAQEQLPQEVILSISNRIQELKQEIDHIKTLQPAKSHKPELVSRWLDSLIESSADELPKLFVERINVNKTDIQVISTLDAVLNENGCGGTHATLPDILWCFVCNLQN